MSIVDTDSYVYPAEHSIRTSKERMRCLFQSLPFSCIPKGIIDGAMFDCTNNLSRLPRNSSIEEHISPLAIVASLPKLDLNLITLSFSDYVETCEYNGFQTNSTNMRVTPAITLCYICNYTVSYKFFSLVTGDTVACGSWTPLRCQTGQSSVIMTWVQLKSSLIPMLLTSENLFLKFPISWNVLMITIILIAPTSPMSTLLGLLLLQIHRIRGVMLVLQLLALIAKHLCLMAALILTLVVLVETLILMLMIAMVVLVQPLRS